MSAAGASALQQRAYVRTGLEDRLAARITSADPPDLVVLSGSAGSGKSHLIQQLRKSCGHLLGDVIEDATHAESPDTEQQDRLLRFFRPFADGQERPGGSPRLIAMNTGMVLKFLSDIRRTGQDAGLGALGDLLLERLSIPRPRAVHRRPRWLDEAVLVINLDNRPTAGSEDSLLRHVLRALDPDGDGGLFAGAPRCGTCSVRQWCYPRANLAIVSSPAGVDTLDRAVGTVALERGREIPPRAVWDFVAGLALGPDLLRLTDPCEAIAGLGAAGGPESARRVADGLIVQMPLDRPSSDLAERVTQLDASFVPSGEAHDIIASAGISHDEDAQRLREWLGQPGSTEVLSMVGSAVCRAEVNLPGRSLARAAWLAGHLDGGAATADEFREILSSYTASSDPETLHAMVSVQENLAAGLAQAFGFTAGPETFFPADRGEDTVSVMVQAHLLGDTSEDLRLNLDPDPVRATNRVGADIVGYRPLALHLRLGGHRMPITYPLWVLLNRSLDGTAARSLDLERFHGLRRALEAVGRIAAGEPGRPALVFDTATGRAYRIAAHSVLGTETLRASEVYPS